MLRLIGWAAGGMFVLLLGLYFLIWPEQVQEYNIKSNDRLKESERTPILVKRYHLFMERLCKGYLYSQAYRISIRVCGAILIFFATIMLEMALRIFKAVV